MWSFLYNYLIKHFIYKVYITNILIHISGNISFYTLNPHIYIVYSTNNTYNSDLYAVVEYYMVHLLWNKIRCFHRVRNVNCGKNNCKIIWDNLNRYNLHLFIDIIIYIYKQLFTIYNCCHLWITRYFSISKLMKY